MNKQQITNDLQTVFNGTPWYGNSILKVIDTVNEKHLNNSFKSGSSIAQTLEHILTWRNYTLELLKENFSYKIEMNSVEDWSNKKTYSIEEWKKLILRLKQNQKEILKLVETKTETALLKQIPERDYNYFEMLNNCIQHDLYHLGQIALLNK